MKTTFYILFFLGVLIYSSKPTVSFKPFSLSFESPLIPFAILFLAAGFLLFGYEFHNRGYKLGVENINKHYTLTKK